MKNRVNYPDLDEAFVKELVKILQRDPQWFKMDHWGIRRVISAPALTPRDIKLRKRSCGTVCCLAGTIGVLKGTAYWDAVSLRVEYRKVDSWPDVVKKGLGVPESTVDTLIYRGSWPFPLCREERLSGISDVDGVLMLLDLLLKDKPLTTENLPSKVKRLAQV